MTEEYFDIVTQDGELTGETKTKSEAHRDGSWHRAVHIWIINSQQELLVQKRSADKGFYPNTWDISTAGQVSAGESLEQAVLREAKEEIGLDLSSEKLEYLFKCLSPYDDDANNYHDNHVNYTYLIQKDLDLEKIKFQKEEIQGLKFIPFRELEEKILARNPQYCPHFEYAQLFKILHKRYD